MSEIKLSEQDSDWVKMHKSLGHKVSPVCERCETCNQTYEEYMNMTKQEKTLFVMRYL